MLSPYLKKESLNGGVKSTRLITKNLGLSGSLDKRSLGRGATGLAKVKDTINVAQTVSDTISNLAGIRSPYYVIGEVPNDGAKAQSAYKYGATGTLVRAVAGLFSGIKQEGVIIDCIGDMSGTMSVEFTKNPVVYQSSTVVDGRIRKPATLKATVYVSNYLSDNAIGAAINAVGQVFGDLVSQAINDIAFNGNTRAQNALYKLRYLMENGEPFTVYTPHGVYSNMLIESINPKTDATTMDCLMCEIVFKEVIMWRPYFNGGKADKIPAREEIVATESNNVVKTIASWF